jgi:hypothetical protein
VTAPLFPACPQLRSHVPPRVVDALAAGGFHVHRVGQAAYLHQATLHLILGVWGPHDPEPAWGGRLGFPSAGYLSRARRLDLEHRGRAYLRDRRGRFLVRLPWYRVPPVQVYSFEPAGMSLVDAEELRAAERRAELRSRGYWA